MTLQSETENKMRKERKRNEKGRRFEKPYTGASLQGKIQVPQFFIS